jgi:hypothetical protein
MDNDLAILTKRVEILEMELSDMACATRWLLGRFRVPMSYVDMLSGEQWLERRMADRRAMAEPPAHLTPQPRPRPNGGPTASQPGD